MPLNAVAPIPPIIAGPIPRRVTPHRLVFWLVLRASLDLRLSLYRAGEAEPFLDLELPANSATQVRIGRSAFVRLLDVSLDHALPTDLLLEYDLRLSLPDGEQSLIELLPHLAYPGRRRPSLVIRSRLSDLVHGSCRKPHFDGPDALLRLDDLIGASVRAASVDSGADRPALMVMTGDQVYCDDVAGPMLAAIHSVIGRLGLYPERILDWNLTRGWEEAAYGHPFSRRIIGNTLVGYWLFQGWGNDPASHGPLLEAALHCFPSDGRQRTATTGATVTGGPPEQEPPPVPPLETLPSGDRDPQDRLIDRLLGFEHWHYSVPTSPKLVVLDTRTHRWWSESSLAKPSGLMDWEELSELQQTLCHRYQ